MRKIILFSILFTCVNAAYSQYFMIKLGGGYSWPGPQQGSGVLTFQPNSNPALATDPAYAEIIPLVSYNTAAADSGNRFKSNIYAGYSEGGHFDFSFGYMFNPYFGIELDGAALWGKNVVGTQVADAGGALGNNATIITTTHSSGISVNPSLVFRAAKAEAKVAPYARLGLALPISGAIYHNLNISAPNSPIFGDVESSNIDVKTTATVSLGFQGAAGISYTPFPLMSFWGEVNGQYLFVRAKQSVLSAYSLNVKGQTAPVNLYSTLSTYSKVTNYVDELTVNSNTTDFGKSRNPTNATATYPNEYVNENAGQDELRQLANLGAFGFTVGVTINMSKKIFKDPLGKKAKAAAATH